MARENHPKRPTPPRSPIGSRGSLNRSQAAARRYPILCRLWPAAPLRLSRLLQRRPTTALQTLLRAPTALPTSRSAWSAPACWRCRRVTPRPETSHPAPVFHKRPDGLLTRRHYPFEGRVLPRPDGNDSMEGPVPLGPRDALEGVPPIGRGGTRSSKAGWRGTHPFIWRNGRL